MAKGYYRQVVEILERHGCSFHRNGKGDHEIWVSPLAPKPFTVDKILKSRHTANSTLKDAGIDEKV
ncbi:MAG: type II toxin-antitoxin system HicA family toxin [Rhodospirillales bacterium]|nr:type II toxin-antitoxin system HicA family toxin [Rhodospirillales bacterium]MCB9996415.1 type II toxin-antitoxin system HicA family toxin [Rhodospirillales bacterium]